MLRAHLTDPTREAIDVLSQRWVLYAVRSLMDGPKGFNELARDCGGASGKVLAGKLDAMERLGIVERAVLSQLPPRTRYTLTPSGHDLRGTIEAVSTWAQDFLAAPLDWQQNASSRAGEASEHPIRMLQEKWTLHIVWDLLHGDRGFNELSRAVGVNVTTLGKRLAQLQTLGLLEVRVGRGMPPRHSYKLTASGRALSTVIGEIERWAQTHLHALSKETDPLPENGPR